MDEASLGEIAPVLAEIPSGAEREIELDGRTYMVVSNGHLGLMAVRVARHRAGRAASSGCCGYLPL